MIANIMNLNKVILIGRLTREVELRTTTSGSSVANVGLATNRFWMDQNKQRQEQTEFHNVVLFGKTAELASQYLVKGQEVYFEGRLQSRTYKGKDNVERRTTEIVAETMQFGSKPQGGSSSYSGGNNYAANAGGYQSNNSNVAPRQNNINRPSAAPVVDDSIPTINLDDEVGEVRIEDVPF